MDIDKLKIQIEDLNKEKNGIQELINNMVKPYKEQILTIDNQIMILTKQLEVTINDIKDELSLFFEENMNKYIPTDIPDNYVYFFKHKKTTNEQTVYDTNSKISKVIKTKHTVGIKRNNSNINNTTLEFSFNNYTSDLSNYGNRKIDTLDELKNTLLKNTDDNKKYMLNSNYKTVKNMDDIINMLDLQFANIADCDIYLSTGKKRHIYFTDNKTFVFSLTVNNGYKQFTLSKFDVIEDEHVPGLLINASKNYNFTVPTFKKKPYCKLSELKNEIAGILFIFSEYFIVGNLDRVDDNVENELNNVPLYKLLNKN